jgi:hypothetical protein
MSQNRNKIYWLDKFASKLIELVKPSEPGTQSIAIRTVSSTRVIAQNHLISICDGGKKFGLDNWRGGRDSSSRFLQRIESIE